MKIQIFKFVLSVFCSLCSVAATAQTDVRYRIGLILPFEAEQSIAKLNAYSSAHDLSTASKIALADDAIDALNFYQGAIQSLNEANGNIKFELSLYDNQNDDSTTRELLKLPELKSLDIIIGSTSASSAKLVADFCKRNRIVNIQPFTPSKSLTQFNSYHLKLSPTLDAHIDALFQSVVDSFAGANVIIYTPNSSSSTAVAKRIDSLFTEYNKTTVPRFTVVSLNTKDMLLNGKKTTAKEQLKPGRTNVLIMTSFEESFVNGNLRVLFDSKDKYNIVVFGMPNWLDGDVMRLDYISDYHTRISNPFYTDSARSETIIFANNYKTAYGVEPASFAYLGYDVMSFIRQSLNDYGKDFLSFISTQRFKGTGYTFDIVKNISYAPANNVSGTDYSASEPIDQINYYENRHVNVFMIQDYRLVKIR